MAMNTMLRGLCRVVTATAWHLQQPLTDIYRLRMCTSEKPITGPSLESREPPAGEGDTAFGVLGGARGCPSSGGQRTNCSVSTVTYRCDQPP